MRGLLRLPAIRARRPKDVRIPSIADEVATDLVTVFSRTSGSRKWGFAEDNFVLIRRAYQPISGPNRRFPPFRRVGG